MKILVIEDNVEISEALSFFCGARKDIECEVANTGQEGLDRIRAEKIHWLIYNFENQMGFIQKLDEALKLTVQFNWELTWRLATASYSPEDQRRFIEIFVISIDS